jgi:hypothetical protein
VVPHADAAGGLRVAGLFAGIGGIELGLHRAGHTTELLCERGPLESDLNDTWQSLAGRRMGRR